MAGRSHDYIGSPIIPKVEPGMLQVLSFVCVCVNLLACWLAKASRNYSQRGRLLSSKSRISSLQIDGKSSVASSGLLKFHGTFCQSGFLSSSEQAFARCCCRFAVVAIAVGGFNGEGRASSSSSLAPLSLSLPTLLLKPVTQHLADRHVGPPPPCRAFRGTRREATLSFQVATELIAFRWRESLDRLLAEEGHVGLACQFVCPQS